MKSNWIRLLAAGLVLAASTSPIFGSRQIIERVIARVNSEIITMRQFDQEKEKLRQTLAEQYSGAALDQQFQEQSKNLLRDLIDQSLMVQKAKDLDINVDTELVKRLDEIRASMHLDSIRDLEKSVESQGLIWEDFQDQIKRNLLMREVIGREVGGRLMVTQAEARKYFQDHIQRYSSPPGVRLAEILISSGKYKPEEAKKRADDCLAALKGGSKWEDMVKKYSDGPAVDEGGDVGFFKAGTLLPAVEKAVTPLDVNDNSGLISISSGYLIVKVLEKRSAGVPRFEEVQQRVDEDVYQEKMQPALRSYLAELRKESYIFLAPGYVDTGATASDDTIFARKGQ